tara:strand:- start:874 stop:1191 length:318 start_codon:yes stop_codon:yes gene_type:complete
MYVYNLYQEYLSRLDSGISENYDDEENNENVIRINDKNNVLVVANQQQSAGNFGTNKKIHGFYNEKQNMNHKYTYRIKKAGRKHATKRRRLRKSRGKTRKTRLRK